MFSFFKKKPAAAPDPDLAPPVDEDGAPEPAPLRDTRSWFDRVRGVPAEAQPALEPSPRAEDEPVSPVVDRESVPADLDPVPVPVPEPEPEPASPPEPRARTWLDRLRGTPLDEPVAEPMPDAPQTEAAAVALSGEPDVAEFEPEPEPEVDRRSWLEKLRGGLRKTGSSIAQVFTGTQIDDALYEELEEALLMADAGTRATEYLLKDLKWRVKDRKAADPAAVKRLLVDAVAELLAPLEAGLVVGLHVPTVMMVVGVNGAGKTTSIGKLTRHLADSNRKVLLAAADTFRAAAREQLAVWAERADTPASVRTGQVEIVSQEGGDPAAVTFDAVVAGKARRCDVVIADTAGRLTTQLHLMEELKKIRRVIGKAQDGAPHEVLLVIDGNTGQNALSQVNLFDAALGLTGLVITKLDGTAKGGVLAAIALWSRDRVRQGGKSLPVYFIGVGERLEDLETFKAREFAEALLD